MEVSTVGLDGTSAIMLDRSRGYYQNQSVKPVSSESGRTKILLEPYEPKSRVQVQTSGYGETMRLSSI